MVCSFYELRRSIMKKFYVVSINRETGRILTVLTSGASSAEEASSFVESKFCHNDVFSVQEVYPESELDMIGVDVDLT
jgi:hypothetical protein